MAWPFPARSLTSFATFGFSADLPPGLAAGLVLTTAILLPEGKTGAIGRLHSGNWRRAEARARQRAPAPKVLHHKGFFRPADVSCRPVASGEAPRRYFFRMSTRSRGWA